ALLIVPSLLLVGLWAWRQQRSPRSAVQLAAAVAAAAALAGGWWYLRNQLLYGDPTAVHIILQTYRSRSIAEGLAVWSQALPYAWTTFWGRFGHGEVVLPASIYQALGAATLLAVVMLAWRWSTLDRFRRVVLVFLTVAGLVELGGLLAYLTIDPSGYN